MVVGHEVAERRAGALERLLEARARPSPRRWSPAPARAGHRSRAAPRTRADSSAPRRAHGHRATGACGRAGRSRAARRS